MADLPSFGETAAPMNTKDAELAAYIKQYVDGWEAWRDNNYKERWDEYYRMFRGTWSNSDATRDSERSRVMGTELSQAIETQVAEIEDAIFARQNWIDISDDYIDPERRDVETARDLLLCEFDENGVKAAISEILLNGAIYGTGIGKVMVDRKKVPTITPEITDPETGRVTPAKTELKTEYCVKLVPVSPRNFVIDPNAKRPDEGMGCAHVWQEPLADVQRKISEGTYRSFPLAPYGDQVEDRHSLGEYAARSETEQLCKIVEWHGLVPARLLSSEENLFDDMEAQLLKEIMGADRAMTEVAAVRGTTYEEMVEAIVVIVNDAHVARKVANPFTFGDRSFIAYQHDTVPGRFWGRGVSEKGYNPQKALDAELRARIDALGYSTHPMMAMDSTKMIRGETFKVRPGRNFLTVGPPMESIMPLKFPPPDPHTFQQSQELREMIQRGTGSYELPAMADNSRMAATSMSMVVGSMIKRSRRVLANIERNLLDPLVKKSVWRLMQFAPVKFPVKDYKFHVHTALGIMAREFEQGQLVSLLSTVPSDSSAFWMLMESIYSLSNIDGREDMIDFCVRQRHRADQPPPPDMTAQLAQAQLELEVKKLEQEMRIHQDKMDIEARKLMQQDMMIQAEAMRDEGEGRMQTATGILQMVKAETEQMKVQSQAMLNVAKAQAEAAKMELEAFNTAMNEKREADAKAARDAKELEETKRRNAEEYSNLLDGLAGAMNAQLSQIKEANGVDENAIRRVFDEFKLQERAQESSAAITAHFQDMKDKMEEMERKRAEAEAKKAEAEAAKQQQGGAEESPDGASPLPGEGAGGGAKIERDANGMVISVNGKKVQRGEDGLISGIE